MALFTYLFVHFLLNNSIRKRNENAVKLPVIQRDRDLWRRDEEVMRCTEICAHTQSIIFQV